MSPMRLRMAVIKTKEFWDQPGLARLMDAFIDMAATYCEVENKGWATTFNGLVGWTSGASITKKDMRKAKEKRKATKRDAQKHKAGTLKAKSIAKTGQTNQYKDSETSVARVVTEVIMTSLLL